jgi:hypothetical protein
MIARRRNLLRDLPNIMLLSCSKNNSLLNGIQSFGIQEEKWFKTNRQDITTTNIKEKNHKTDEIICYIYEKEYRLFNDTFIWDFFIKSILETIMSNLLVN